jgi:hypothetical protein
LEQNGIYHFDVQHRYVCQILIFVYVVYTNQIKYIVLLYSVYVCISGCTYIPMYVIIHKHLI